MSQHIDAIYDNGVFKPTVPLSLPDKARVILTVEPQARADVQPRDEWEQRLVALPKDCGVSLPDSALSSEELYE